MTKHDPSGLAGDAFVAIWHDIAPEGLDTFYEWHDREHMPERLAVPGFRRGRRFIRVEGDGQEFFNLYEVDSFDVLVGCDYLARLNAPTPWTTRVVVHFRNVTRGLCRVTGSVGIGRGGVLATVRLAPAPDRHAELRRHLLEIGLPSIATQAGIVGAHLGFTDETGSRIDTSEKQARGNPTDIPPWVLLVEGISREHLRRATSELLAGAGVAHETTVPPIAGIYRLEAECSKDVGAAR